MDQLHEAYQQVRRRRRDRRRHQEALRNALDQASSAFFAAQPSLSPDGQKELVAAWAEKERAATHRPVIAIANGSASTPASAKKKIVRGYIDGCYDVMHSGHYNAIRQAKSLCDELIVGLHSNAEIEREKGPPVMNDEERLAAVKACKWVDRVEFGVPYTPSIALLDQLECDFCVHGDDDALAADGTDVFAAAKAAGRMAIVKRTEGVSTTDLVNRLLAMTKKQPTHAHTPAPLTTVDATQPATAVVCSESLSSPLPLPSPCPSPLSPSALDGSSAVSSFLPTTWRLSQFSNHRVPKSTDKVVYISGGWDLFHVGHIERLAAAKALGTFLYVGIHDDATVRAYKGSTFPVMSIHERVLNVLSNISCDEVVIGAPWQVSRDMITTLNISVIAEVLPSPAALARVQRQLPDPCAAVRSLGIVQTVASKSTLSTDVVIQRILDNRAKYEQRNARRAVKDLNYAAKKAYVEEK